MGEADNPIHYILYNLQHTRTEICVFVPILFIILYGFLRESSSVHVFYRYYLYYEKTSTQEPEADSSIACCTVYLYRMG